VSQTGPSTAGTAPGAAFVERHVDVDDFRIRYLEAGSGDPLVCLHASGGPRLSRGHDLLAARYRVILFEMPGFGASAANERSKSAADLARTMAGAVAELGIERYNLWGTSFGGRIACWLAVQYTERIEALVLVGPAAILPEGRTSRTAGVPLADRARLYFAHPERQPPSPPPDPAEIAKQEALVGRLRGPNRDADLERRLAGLHVPTLVLFGTEDRLIPAEMGRVYREIMPNCHLILVYDAGHHIDADRPEAFVSVVSDFLDRREQFVVTRTSSLIDP
jgi:4,5:9,10-diseco-3-hydroxy-5,9,17-trioxoandrosta-1(10),2-diene-4-oate hydrolase